jgi:hypothetical protein
LKLSNWLRYRTIDWRGLLADLETEASPEEEMWPATLIAVLNSVILIGYAVFERDLPIDFAWARSAILAAALVIILSVLAAGLLGRRALNAIANVQLALLSCLMLFVLIEVIFLIAPGIFPDNVRRFVEAAPPSSSARERVVELLPHPPYAKPRANTTIHIPGYYGPKESFVYQWTTDRRGFKNTAAIAAREAFEVVAPGDSFTEGMGVLVEDTWTSKLSKLGHPAYSLGVQGYAPIQFRGAYEHYGRSLSPKWVIVAYTGGVYARQSVFQSERHGKVSSRELPSAIGRLVERDELEEQRPIYLETKDGHRVPIVLKKHHRFVTSAFVMLARHTLHVVMLFEFKVGAPPDDARFMSDQDLQRRSAEFRLKPMARYRGEFLSFVNTKADPDRLSQDPLWLSTEREFEQIIAMARQDRAGVLFLFFPNRATAYYERATGQSLPSNTPDLVESALLARFARRHGVEMMDLTPAFRSYVATLNDGSPIEQYPYLSVDGHPSPKGHELIATEVARFLSSRQSASR